MAADLLAGEPCKALGQCMRSTHGLESRSATLAVRPFESENIFDVVKLECCNAGTRTGRESCRALGDALSLLTNGYRTHISFDHYGIAAYI